MGPDSDALAILTLLQLQGVGPATVRKILTDVQGKSLSLADALAAPEALAQGLSREQTRGIEAASEHAATAAAKVSEAGGRLLAVTDPDYPAALLRTLGHGAPPLLTALGNVGLLERVGVGFCGSRAASEKGLAVASDCAGQLARAGANVVSGYAAGVDMATHKAALSAKGSTAVVVAEGILHFRVKREIESLWDPAQVVVLSEFLPDSVWSASNAMRRNRTICGLSRAMVLIEARGTGGSLAAGRACLELGVPLFAAVYGGMPAWADGNRQLIGDGAQRLLKSRASGRANVSPILQALGMRVKSEASAIGHTVGPQS